MKIGELINELGLETLVLADPDVEATGGYAGDLLSWVMGRAQEGQVWVTIMTNLNVLAVASLAGVAAVVIAEGAEIGADVIARAELQGINLLRSGEGSFETVLAVGRALGMTA